MTSFPEPVEVMAFLRRRLADFKAPHVMAFEVPLLRVVSGRKIARAYRVASGRCIRLLRFFRVLRSLDRLDHRWAMALGRPAGGVAPGVVGFGDIGAFGE